MSNFLSKKYAHHFFIAKEIRDDDDTLVDIVEEYHEEQMIDLANEDSKQALINYCEYVIRNELYLPLDGMTIRIYDEENDLMGVFDWYDGKWWFCSELWWEMNEITGLPNESN